MKKCNSLMAETISGAFHGECWYLGLRSGTQWAGAPAVVLVIKLAAIVKPKDLQEVVLVLKLVLVVKSKGL